MPVRTRKRELAALFSFWLAEQARVSIAVPRMTLATFNTQMSALALISETAAERAVEPRAPFLP